MSRWDAATIGLAALVAATGLTGTVAAVARIADHPTAMRVDGASPGHGPFLHPAQPMAGIPVAVRIPAIGVDTELVPLGLSADGGLEVPPYDRAGWFRGGPKPGETGAAVVAAHVDSRTGPAVFYQLSSVRAGDAVTVEYDDGSTLEFVATGADTYPKSAFPSESVYGPTDGAELRLITCSGPFDRRTGSYRDNLVVWATASVGRLPPR